MFNGFDMVMMGDIHKRNTFYLYDEMEVDEAELNTYLSDGWEIT
jgi:hypothetical protein